MKNEKNLKATSIFVNDDLTPLRAKITHELRKKENIRGVITANE